MRWWGPKTKKKPRKSTTFPTNRWMLKRSANRKIKVRLGTTTGWLCQRSKLIQENQIDTQKKKHARMMGPCRGSQWISPTWLSWSKNDLPSCRGGVFQGFPHLCWLIKRYSIKIDVQGVQRVFHHLSKVYVEVSRSFPTLEVPKVPQNVPEPGRFGLLPLIALAINHQLLRRW